jgi:hypothetical protein
MNKTPQFLHIELLSDTTFGRGQGTTGQVDTEIEHDEFGMPYIGGKTIRGLLRDTWLSMQAQFPCLSNAAERVLGATYSLNDTCRLRIGDARLPEFLREIVHTAIEREESPLSPTTIRNMFTTIRYQTAENRTTGAPETTTLRASRAAVRGLSFEAPLAWLHGYEPTSDDLSVLALCVLCTRHGGLLRNRGRGHLRITFENDVEATRKHLETTT